MNLEESYNKIEELYIFLYENHIDDLSGSDRRKLAKNLKKCIDIVDEYEYLLDFIDCE